LQHIALAVPDATGRQEVLHRFSAWKAASQAKRIVMRCQGRDQDQVILIEGQERSKCTMLCFGTKADELEGLKEAARARRA